MKTALLGATIPAIPINAGSIGVSDPGGLFGGEPLTLQDVIDLWATLGGIDGYYLNTLGGKDKLQALGALGATETIDMANASVFLGTMSANCTVTFTGWTNLRRCTIGVSLTADGTSVPTFSGVTWIGGTPFYDSTAATVTHFLFFSDDGGSTIYGSMLGGGSGSDATHVWMPLTTVVGGVPELVWDADNSLIPTFVPV